MKTSEKILVTLAVAAVLWAVWSVVFSKKDAGAPSPVATRAVKTEAAQLDTQSAVLLKDRPSEVEAYVVEAASQPWGRDPFHVWIETEQEKVLTLEEGLILQYTGFMDIAGQRFAVVNGMEYQSGQVIENTPYRIRAIRPAWVEIEDADAGGTLRIPYQEEWQEDKGAA